LVFEDPRLSSGLKKCPGPLEKTELSEYQPYTSYVIATPALTPHKVLTQIAYSVLENFRGLELPRTRTRTRTCSSRTKTRTWKLVLEDPRGQGLSSRTTTLHFNIFIGRPS